MKKVKQEPLSSTETTIPSIKPGKRPHSGEKKRRNQRTCEEGREHPGDQSTEAQQGGQESPALGGSEDPKDPPTQRSNMQRRGEPVERRRFSSSEKDPSFTGGGSR